MASYKGVQVEEAVLPFLPHMPLIDEYRENLLSLQSVWDVLSLLGQMSGTTAVTGTTREEFSVLTSELLNSLAERTLAKRTQEMTSKAHVVIDILVRNLFERTADIGFLTTDDVIRTFAQKPGNTENLSQRFNEYVRKYSVYEDVVLLDKNGRVVARLLTGDSDLHVDEAWVQDAISTSASYVEFYGNTDLFAIRDQTLIYAFRVTSKGGNVLGVLALCFRFEDEMQRIFRELSGGDDATVLALLNSDGNVIACSDRWQIPLGATLNLIPDKIARLRFAGRTYLAFACKTKGYQGYMGPQGWMGVVMIPIDLAFELQHEKQDSSSNPILISSVMSSGKAFPESLQSIPRKAQMIQQDLGRSIWNGLIRQGSASSVANSNFSKILLSEISRVGMRMGNIFSRSIGNLQTTVISSILSDCQFFASLAISIMDRNLYERANDCRWWALDPTINQLVASASQDQRTGLEQVLRYINGLYTVYDNLLVFDCKGVVLAVSNPNYGDFVGAPIDAPWISEGLALRHSQQYIVSDFVPTALYADRPTYIYVAAIGGLGGIAIVFDSEPQFEAMLQDALPRESDGSQLEGSFALFIDSRSTILASTNSTYQVGDVIKLPSELISPNPDGSSMLFELDGQIFAIGARRSTGYREFKGIVDAYRNEVTALVFIPLGPYDPNAELARPFGEVKKQQVKVTNTANSIEVATFCLSGYWLGLPAYEIVEAVELRGFVRFPESPKQVFGAQIYENGTLTLFNLHVALGLPVPTEAEVVSNDSRQVIVVKADGGKLFGILVDELGDVMEVALSDIDDIAKINVNFSPILASVIKTPPSEGAPLVVLLSASQMIEQLRQCEIPSSS